MDEHDPFFEQNMIPLGYNPTSVPMATFTLKSTSKCNLDIVYFF